MKKVQIILNVIICMEITKNDIKNGMFNYLLITLRKGKTKRRREKSTSCNSYLYRKLL